MCVTWCPNAPYTWRSQRPGSFDADTRTSHAPARCLKVHFTAWRIAGSSVESVTSRTSTWMVLITNTSSNAARATPQ